MSHAPIRVEPRRPESRFVRAGQTGIRCLDLLGAGPGLLLLSPFLLAVAVAIKLTSPGPALFRSIRIGRNGRLFSLYKFRSMTVGAENAGPAITSARDPRVTPLGGKLRRTKLDELPQLLNVLWGEMSLVGPRPEAPSYVALYSREQLAVLEAKPGMTSPASLRYRDEEAQLTGEDWEEHYVREVMPAKLAIDLEYLGRRSTWSDLRMILETVGGLVAGRTSPVS